MQELIRITYDCDRPTVLARDLHEFLEIATPFKKWFCRMCEFGFINGIDYVEVLDKFVQNSKGGRPSTDYQITLDMAKEIGMIQRSEKGRQIRNYFIECERELSQPIDGNSITYDELSELSDLLACITPKMSDMERKRFLPLIMKRYTGVDTNMKRIRVRRRY